MKIIIGISGATGVIYGIRLVRILSEISDVEVHLIISQSAELCIEYETDWKVKDVKSLADRSYDNHDIGAAIGSGSFRSDGMVVIPCSMKTLSAIAHSYDDNLLVRAGDVTLKERRKLILVARETPLHLGHILNMKRIAEIGGIILPPSPAFYHRPNTIEDIIDHVIARVLDQFAIRYNQNLFPRWAGL